MTFSIVARCPRTGQLGVGAITAMMGVGKLVSHARPHVGAVASQASMNPYLAFDGLALMDKSCTASEALDMVIAGDPGRDVRQVGMIDARGNAAAWSGERTEDWSGHLLGDGFATQGNRLVGRVTLEAVAEAFNTHPDRDLAERLLEALEAGEETGADTKGAVSGTILVMDTEDYPLWDIRVDVAEDPAARLREIHAQFRQELLPQILRLPTREDPVGDLTREVLGS